MHNFSFSLVREDGFIRIGRHNINIGIFGRRFSKKGLKAKEADVIKKDVTQKTSIFQRDKGPVKIKRTISLPFSLIFTYRVLILCLFCLGIFFVYHLIDISKKEKVGFLNYSVSKKANITIKLPEQKPFRYYASSIGSRNIFSPIVKDIPKTEQVEVKLSAEIDAIKARLNLLGIVSGERPQAIIEDKKAKKTYFLYKGDFISNAQVIEILQGRVRLKYKGEEFELFL